MGPPGNTEKQDWPLQWNGNASNHSCTYTSIVFQSIYDSYPPIARPIEAPTSESGEVEALVAEPQAKLEAGQL